MTKALRYICPFCGTEVAVGKNCPGCAKNLEKPQLRKKGWEQDKSADGLNLPTDDFNYDEFIAREFGKPHQMIGLKWYWWALAVVLLAGMIYGIFKR